MKNYIKNNRDVVFPVLTIVAYSLLLVADVGNLMRVDIFQRCFWLSFLALMALAFGLYAKSNKMAIAGGSAAILLPLLLFVWFGFYHIFSALLFVAFVMVSPMKFRIFKYIAVVGVLLKVLCHVVWLFGVWNFANVADLSFCIGDLLISIALAGNLVIWWRNKHPAKKVDIVSNMSVDCTDGYEGAMQLNDHCFRRNLILFFVLGIVCGVVATLILGDKSLIVFGEAVLMSQKAFWARAGFELIWLGALFFAAGKSIRHNGLIGFKRMFYGMIVGSMLAGLVFGVWGGIHGSRHSGRNSGWSSQSW